MKKLLLLAILAGSIGALRANTYTFTPPSKIGLDHSYAYTWGFSRVFIPVNQEITKAVLTISGINNWSSSEDGKNWLYTSLIDSVVDQAPYSRSGNDGKIKPIWEGNDNTDFFATWSNSVHIGTYTDNDGGTFGDHVTLTYTFSTLGLLDELSAYINNGNNFAFGFDPDCHYDYCSIKFVITTECRRPPVPETSATLVLLALGLLAIPGFKRLFRA